uniref:PH domain-containing protein n=1 Tax=Laticauda laticaudata TaxID=8630 RepID=A0A8C5WV69_LATLA
LANTASLVLYANFVSSSSIPSSKSFMKILKRTGSKMEPCGTPLELKEKIQPEILELIKQQRLNRLVEGTCFRKLNSRRRQDKFWYCRLSPNHKVLHYGDLEESPQGEVPHDSLQDKLQCDISSNFFIIKTNI